MTIMLLLMIIISRIRQHGLMTMTDSVDRLLLELRHWYAAEFIGAKFGSEIRSHSPIRVDEAGPNGGRRFSPAFHHANYQQQACSAVRGGAGRS